MRDDPESTAPPLLEMRGIEKSFGTQRVLHGVDLELRAGEVHVLAGENGAGKSTLIRVLGGVHRPDAGEVRLHGLPRRFSSPREASRHGVALIHQELSLVPSMSVADNLFLGRERSTRGWLHAGRQQEEAIADLDRLGLDLDVRRPVSDLPISVQQMIEITKALVRRARVIVMDEPTSALNESEVERLFALIGGLTERGCGVIYITHKLEEIYRVGDRITVLRDGRRVVTARAEDLSTDELIRHMVGRDLGGADDARDDGVRADAPVRLAVEDLTVGAGRRGGRPLVENVSFAVRGGEILGLAGLRGSGRSELLLSLFGARGRTSGRVRIDGRPVRPGSVRRSIRRGMALVTNDRQRTGLVLSMSVAANVTLASLARVSPGGWVQGARERDLAAEVTDALQLRAASLGQTVATLSGGNQQKVVLAKWICARPRVLLLDEPTRGVDVGAKQEIYDLLNEWRRAGHAVVLTTSELPELLMMSDRILVLYRGREAVTLDRREATQERILRAAMGGET